MSLESGNFKGRRTSKKQRVEESHMRVGGFIAFVLCGYLFNRVLAVGYLPTDARRVWKASDMAVDLVPTCIFSVALAWLVRVNDAARCGSLYEGKIKTSVIALVFLATGPVFSGLGNIPGWSAISVSSASSAALPVSLIVVLVIVGLVGTAAVLVTFKAMYDEDLATTYIVTQLAVMGLFVVSYAVANAAYTNSAGNPKAQFYIPHMHHLYIGFLVASFGQAKGWASDLLLAIGLGIFVQGVGAYGFEPIVAPKKCALATMADVANIANGEFVTQFSNPLLQHCFTVVQIVF